ncbi:hypothetical protein Pmani_019724 [Petrolisthes manimaculis]|uniref:Secreted protein n=1 Tax=Petrolisthes manimaculis TaxID=1843537 RepID=A0AAE1U746_9EUCA|nr:hypothetical protein Pmani_019724 [Petrolisthes manimaculis]
MTPYTRLTNSGHQVSLVLLAMQVFILVEGASQVSQWGSPHVTSPCPQYQERLCLYRLFVLRPLVGRRRVYRLDRGQTDRQTDNQDETDKEGMGTQRVALPIFIMFVYTWMSE